MSAPTLQRETFVTSRLLEYFSKKELTTQIGHPPGLWPLALAKELIDNALDACESAGIPPEIRVAFEDDALLVEDNGPGLPESVLRRSLDYAVRVSTNTHYVSPTRGQQGNALKTVWAVPFVLDGERGRVEVEVPGSRYVVDVHLDRIAQEPRLTLGSESAPTVRNGTLVRVHLPSLASYRAASGNAAFYNLDVAAYRMAAGFALLNPHLSLGLNLGVKSYAWMAATPSWRKWQPSLPTSAYWYTGEQFSNLIAAYIAAERDSNTSRTVRELIGEFRGLSATAKQKAIAAEVELSGKLLTDLAPNDEVDQDAAARLLAVMRRESRPVAARQLGELGREALTERMVRDFGVDEDSVQYRREEVRLDLPADPDTDVPLLLEVAFGAFKVGTRARVVANGVNWTPSLEPAFPSLMAALERANVDRQDPTVMVVHAVIPGAAFLDRGKTRIAVDVAPSLDPMVEAVTKKWTRLKRNAKRATETTIRQYMEVRPKTLSIKQACFQMMEQAYLKASANGTLPAKGRQIMYAARPLVMALTGGQFYKAGTQTFQQSTLIDFMAENPNLTDGWDVVWDDRGHIREPHTNHRVGLGTLAVRRYCAGWTNGHVGDFRGEVFAALDRSSLVGTQGPHARYGAVLFIEKEGFDELFDAVFLRQRYDLAIMSTKGMSVTAARKLVDEIGQVGLPIFALHDLDKNGMSIAHTLGADSRRYRFEHPPTIIDLGLRLEDVRALGLEDLAEEVEYDSKKNPRVNLAESGATDDEQQFLVSGQQRGKWIGRRVELNAMTSDQFIAWLEAKLQAQGVRKVVPDQHMLEAAYRRAQRIEHLRQTITAELSRLETADVDVPADLTEQVSGMIAGKQQSWDAALRDLVLGGGDQAWKESRQ